MREIGTICQIGISAAEQSTFWGSKRAIFSDFALQK